MLTIQRISAKEIESNIINCIHADPIAIINLVDSNGVYLSDQSYGLARSYNGSHDASQNLHYYTDKKIGSYGYCFDNVLNIVWTNMIILINTPQYQAKRNIYNRGTVTTIEMKESLTNLIDTYKVRGVKSFIIPLIPRLIIRFSFQELIEIFNELSKDINIILTTVQVISPELINIPNVKFVDGSTMSINTTTVTNPSISKVCVTKRNHYSYT